ncbi:MAG: class F sortase [Chloroflexota bacterium]
MSDSKQDTRPIFLQKTVQLTALNKGLKGKSRHPMYPRIARRERRIYFRIVHGFVSISLFVAAAYFFGIGIRWAEAQISQRLSERRATTQLSIPALTGEEPLLGYIASLTKRNRALAASDSNASYKPGGRSQPINPNIPTAITKPIGATALEAAAATSGGPDDAFPIIATDLASTATGLDELSMRLIIPQIEIDHEVVQVPLVEGIWDVEELGQQIGRLEGTGRFPGDNLSMTLVAHATTTWPEWGPFQELDRLPLGAEIVLDVEGVELRYEITRFRYVEPHATGAAFGENGNQLILITCGNYDFVRGEYQKRLVAYADLVEG